MTHHDGHQPLPLTLRCFDTEHVVALCIARQSDELNCELAVLHPDYPGGDSDSRLVQEGTLSARDGKSLTVRVFSPGSGCDVIIEGGVVRFTEDGLQGLHNLRVSKLRVNDEYLLVVWKDEPKKLSDQDIVWIYNKVNGLALTFG